MRRSKIAIGTLLSLGAWTTLQACGSDERFSVDEDRDGWPSELDCDDDDPSSFPSAEDVPGDGIDQDCSGEDASKGGLGGEPSSGGSAGAGNGSGSSPGTATGGREAAGGAENAAMDRDGDGVRAPVDCDDNDPSVRPGAFDLPWDGIDQDCSGNDSEDRDGDGFDGGTEGADCDDTRSEVFPGAVEIINNRVDENCDGSDLLSEPTISAKLGEAAVVAAAPDIALLKTDDQPELLVVWIDARRGDPRDIFAQRLTLQGDRVGPEITISNSDPNPKSEVHLFARDGGFLVTWMTSEGGWARQLGPNGEPTSIALGISEPGSTGLTAAFGGAELEGGGTWGLVWLSPLEEAGQRAFFRAMTLDEIRGEPISLDDGDSVHHVTLTGTLEGFLPLWEGDFEETRGIVASHLDRLGEPLEDPWLVWEGAVGEPTLVPVESGYSLVFRNPGSLGHVAGLFLDDDFAPVQDVPLRLSGDVGLQSGFRLVEGQRGVVALWNDGRHLLDATAVEAVYGQHFTHDAHQPERQWGADRAIYAGVGGELGDAVVHDDDLIVAFRSESRIGLMVQSLE